MSLDPTLPPSRGSDQLPRPAKVAIVGAGLIGRTVAQLAVAGGWRVSLRNSRAAESLSGLVRELGPLAEAADPDTATGDCALVVVSVPVLAYADLRPGPLLGQLVIDTGNYSAERDGPPGGRSERPDRLLAALAPSARLAKAFNTIHFEHLAGLARPRDAADRTALPIAGDDPCDRSVVAAFLDDLGYDSVEIGDLGEEWRLRPGQPAFGLPYSGGRPDFAAAPATAASGSTVAAAVAAAVPVASQPARGGGRG